MSEEFVGELRRNGRIHVKGSDVPPPINSFADLEHIGVQKPLVEALLKQYSTPTPIQARLLAQKRSKGWGSQSDKAIMLIQRPDCCPLSIPLLDASDPGTAPAA